MRKLLLIVGAVVLLALGVGAGIFLQSHYRLVGGGADADLAAKLVTGVALRIQLDDAPVPPAPPLDTWSYPGAQSGGSGSSGSVTANGRRIRSESYYAKWITPDDYDKVLDFYADRGPFDKELLKRSPWATGTDSGSDSETFALSLNRPHKDVDKGNSTRPVRSHCLIRRSRSYDVHVFLSRGENERHTHILVFYYPKSVTEGDRDLVLTLLAAKFGPLPAEVAPRVAAMNGGELRAVTMRLLTAKSLPELGLQN